MDTASLEEELGGGVGYLEIEDVTSPTLDDATLMADPTITGEFYRAMKPLLESGDARSRRIASKALKAGLAALRAEDLPL